jgi:hypothetical protein
MFGRIIKVLIDTQHHSEVFSFRRSRNEHLFHGPVQMSSCLCCIGKKASRLDDNFNPQVTEGEYVLGHAGSAP